MNLRTSKMRSKTARIALQIALNAPTSAGCFKSCTISTPNTNESAKRAIITITIFPMKPFILEVT